MTNYIENDPFFTYEEWEQMNNLETKKEKPQLSEDLKREMANYRKELEDEMANKKNEDIQKAKELGQSFKVPKDEVKIPLPTHTDIIKGLNNKEYAVVGAMCMLSNFNDVKEDEKDNPNLVDGAIGKQNYIYRNKVNDTLNNLKYIDGKGNEKTISIRTVERYIKKLENQFNLVETINTPNGIAYKINFATDGKYFTTIPFVQLRELVTSTNSTMLKLYAVLSYQLSTTEFKEMDRWYLAEQIGLSPKAKNNLDDVGVMVRTLANLGFITIMVKNRLHYDETTKKNYNKTIYKYRLNTYDEYLEAKKRGILYN